MNCKYLSTTPKRVPRKIDGNGKLIKITMLPCCKVPHVKNKFHEGIVGSPANDVTLLCGGDEFTCPQASLLFVHRNKK